MEIGRIKKEIGKKKQLNTTLLNEIEITTKPRSRESSRLVVADDSMV
jgi:hypothetical protein